MSEPNPLGFAQEILKWFPDLRNFDCGDIQELADKHGLLTKERRTTKCADDGSCNCDECLSELEMECGFDCYHVHPLLTGNGGGT